MDILNNISIYYIPFWDANKFTKITMGCSQSSVQPQQEEEAKEKTIQKLETIIENVVLDTEVYIQAIIETEDKRIATGGSDGNISISSYDINEKKFQRDIYEELAHNGEVRALCSLKGNRLLSGGVGGIIKLWALSTKTITLTKEIDRHFGTINHLILLSHERFASCSDDGTARVWKNDETFECISLFDHENEVTTTLQLKGKEELVTASFYFNGSEPGAKTGYISFWSLISDTEEHTIRGYGVCFPSHMIELPDGNIALCTKEKPFLLVFIDCINYQVKMTIDAGMIIICSSLCVIDKRSFIYAFFGYFL